MYIPLSNKLSLHKNKKKRVGVQKRSVFDDEAEGASKVNKISEKAPDQYVIAARGYSSKEVQEANAAFKALHCEAEIAREAAGGMPGITFFRSEDDL